MGKNRCGQLVLVLLCSLSVYGQNKEGKARLQQPADVVEVVVVPARAREIRKLLDVLPATPGGTNEANNLVDQTIAAYRKQYTSVPEEVWKTITSDLKKDFGPDRLGKTLAPIYANHFTDGEIRQLTAFFRSPVGRKWAAVMPEIQRETYNAGDGYGYLMGERVNKILIAKGFAVPTGR